jgi:hypothetical protein
MILLILIQICSVYSLPVTYASTVTITYASTVTITYASTVTIPTNISYTNYYNNNTIQSTSFTSDMIGLGVAIFICMLLLFLCFCCRTPPGGLVGTCELDHDSIKGCCPLCYK